MSNSGQSKTWPYEEANFWDNPLQTVVAIRNSTLSNKKPGFFF